VGGVHDTADRDGFATDLPARLQRVHMIGIGGAGMSGIARILLARGGQVSGSDAKESRAVIDLRARGAKIRIGHDAAALDALDGGPTAVISTLSAIPKDNPELLAAAEREIPVLLRPAVLAELLAERRAVLIAGTHGKTSTTSMTVVALQHCRADPSFVVGGELNESGTNAHHGTGPDFVAEADESDGSLLLYRPSVAVVTNIDADHLDFFGSLEAYRQVFDDFVERLEPGGLLVACLDDPGSATLAVRAHRAGVRVLGYGITVDGGAGAGGPVVPGLDEVPVGARLEQWTPTGPGGTGAVHLPDGTVHRLTLAVPGTHMALNALSTLLAITELGHPAETVLEGLAQFGGVHRRFQDRGTVGGVRVVDDYAHHPTEVRAVLGAARDIVADSGGGRVIVVFQPHLYSRTAAFADEFADALGGADIAVVLDVYGAREEPVPGVTGALIAGKVRAGTRTFYQPDLSAAAEQVAQLAREGDIVLTTGAGDVTVLGPEIVAVLGRSATPQ